MHCLIKRFFTTCLFVAAIASWAGAQENSEIRGTVTDGATGETLPGVNVMVTGTVRGTTTDVNGNYVVKNIAAGSYSVTASFVGYRSMTKQASVTAGKSAKLDFGLVATSVQMNTVVVTGQGVATEKRKLASSVETISAREIEAAPVRSVDQLLQGRVPGLSSFAPSGMPGSGARLATRGIKSALSTTTPVIYIDGIRLDNRENYRLSFGTGGQVTSSLSDIVTGEIDRVEVIKGGAGSTLYGSEAANGVIQIFTKKGIPGPPRWRFNATTGYDVPEEKFIQQQYTKDHAFQNGQYQSYSAAVTGGSDIITYTASGRMSQGRGIIPHDKLQDQQYVLGSGLRALLSNESSLEVSASFSHSVYNRMINDNAGGALISDIEIEGLFDPLVTSNPDSLLALYFLPGITERSNRFINAINFNYAPMPGWNNKFTVGIDYRRSEDRQFTPISAGDFLGSPGGGLSASQREYITTTMAYAGSYKLPELGVFSQTFSLGAQGFRVDDHESYGQGQNFKIPGTTDFDNASVIDAQEDNRQLFSYGFYAQHQVGIADRVFIDLGLRLDGNSTFGKDVGLQTYPKIGVAYNVSEEPYYPEMVKSVVSSFKVRAAWGETGNFPPPFTRDRTYVSNVYLNESAISFNNAGDPLLGPERTSSIDAGFDMGLLDDRIGLEFTYFTQTTKDALFNVAEDPAGGFGNQRRNVGKIKNSGIELAMRAQVLQSEDFDINVRASVATLTNEATSLGGAAGFTIAGFSFAPMRVEEGKPIGIIRVNVPRLEADGTYKGNYDERYLGNPTPKQTGAVGIDLVLFKNLSITAFGEFALGHQILNQSLSRQIVNALNVPGLYPDAIAKLPVSADPARPYNRNTASSILLENGDWIKLREISLRYKIPAGILNGISLNASVRNVAIFGTKTTYVDPELSFIPGAAIELGGITGATFAPPIQYRIGMDVNI
ncbi:MAG TPA: TonB-dependent receptor [Bacteroidota bacterium]|nr:TonB-dependent receptor [Bacteroidota bacterium]